MLIILQSIRAVNLSARRCASSASSLPLPQAAAAAAAVAESGHDVSAHQQLLPTPPARRSASGSGDGHTLACVPSLSRACATACLWLAVKLEEDRRTAPPVRVLAALSRTSAAELASMELRVLQWLEWAPCRGYLP
ncbi:hypothetical protein HYH02_000600 [Chlamydomonas schloesseri]|uniref:Uncharacterized protein n=1 Tax=Chlamydomonas schloesseri TaxID=2026947 RepID=A0A835WVZ2_9CHLO|nr:hypothetical protein HYH02_000600 [Chlamydomonas schloesseri]|eukprot:KAG2454765.1 hypothetical protein HYH02_000600 [Chlamydomonas schloesseri]